MFKATSFLIRSSTLESLFILFWFFGIAIAVWLVFFMKNENNVHKIPIDKTNKISIWPIWIYVLLAIAVVGGWILCLYFLPIWFGSWSVAGGAGSAMQLYGVLVSGIVLVLIAIGLNLQREDIQMQRNELTLQREELISTREVFAQQRFEMTFFSLLQNQRDILKSYIYRREEPLKDPVKGLLKGTRIVEISGQERIREIRRRFVILYKFVCARSEDNSSSHSPDSHTILSFTPDMYVKTTNAKSEGLLDTEIDRIKVAWGLLTDEYDDLLGHYFRHLFHLLKFISSSTGFAGSEESLSQDNKEFEAKQYADIVQAQMSIDELFLTFYNAVKFEKFKELVNAFSLLENLPLNQLLSEDHNDFVEFDLRRAGNSQENSGQ